MTQILVQLVNVVMVILYVREQLNVHHSFVQKEGNHLLQWESVVRFVETQ